MFATNDDIDRCKLLLQYILRDKGISLEDDSINEIVKRVLALTYAKGGDYTEGSLDAYIRIYLRDNPV
ncbi:MAG: hypothetical protein K8S20_15545 [Chloroflexi bacterium]|nr:hypothetical protein [Chloroflexota bacterium]